MALPIPELNAYVHNAIIPKITDTIFKRDPVYTRLMTKCMDRYTGGIQIQRPIMIGKLNGGPIRRGQAFNIDYVTTDGNLNQNIKGYEVNITIYGFDRMINNGPESVFNEIALKFENAGLTMAELLAIDMYQSAQDPGRDASINGFAEIYDDGNLYPSYGGITRSTVNPVGVVGGLNAYAATVNTFQLSTLNTAYGNAQFGPDHVDLIAATQNGWNLIWKASQPSQRYPGADGSGSDVLNAGFRYIRFNAAEVVVAQYMPTGTNGVMYGLNTDFIEWYFSTEPLWKFGFTGWKNQSNTFDHAGQFAVGTQMLGVNPRTGFKILSTAF